MPLPIQTERYYDPSAPVVFDLALCEKLVRAAPAYMQMPMGNITHQLAGQLKCLLQERQSVVSKVEAAQAEVARFQKETETANAEMKLMQTMLATAREERDAAVHELAGLKAVYSTKETEPEPAAPAAPVVRRRGRPRKIVPMPEPQQKVAQ